uniref:CX domain-containing protein n=1 Tax=Mesocestoides corti TaxID=53468 RepID=A0A5K3FLI1_MESCO
MKSFLIISFVHFSYITCQAYDGSFPQFLIESKGGVTRNVKKEKFRQATDLFQVAIPAYLSSLVTHPENLYDYTICNGAQGQHKYYICPYSNISSTSTDTKDFCCGVLGSQYCCSEAEFRQGIQIIRPSLMVSPSILIGAALATLLGMMTITLMVFARFHPSNLQVPLNVIHPDNKRNITRSTNVGTRNISSPPPSGQLISSDSGRYSMRHSQRGHSERGI